MRRSWTTPLRAARTSFAAHRAPAIHDQVIEGVAAVGRRLKLGYHTENPDLGPLISAGQLARVQGYVRDGLGAGAELVAGAGHPMPDTGFFFPPTVLTGVGPATSVAPEEIFGPVLVAMRFDDTDTAVALANDTPYGLAGSVFTRDVGRAHAVAARIRAGRVGINVHSITDLTMPGGGYKQSGWGRENGPDSVEPYLETKSVFTLLDS